MKYITVLDFEDGKVYQYTLKVLYRNSDGVVDHEEYLANKGHNMKNCEWMLHSNNEIIKE